MALLSSCWLIVESIIIQDGFLKCSYLNFYINPVFLSICQVLLWLNLLYSWLRRLFRLFYDVAWSFLVMFYKLLIRYVLFTGRVESRQEIDTVNLEVFRRVQNYVPVFYSHSFSVKAPVMWNLKVIQVKEGEILEEENEFFSECENDSVLELSDENDGGVDEKNMEEDLEFECEAPPMAQTNDIEEDENSSVDDGEDIVTSNNNLSTRDVGRIMNSSDDATYSGDLSSFSVSSLDLELQDSMEIENQTPRDRDEDERDEIYEQYCERMRWYDILNHDRAFGLSAILNQKTARSLHAWDKTAEKRLKETIERDLELVYVAQSCLSWEALQHQYIKVRDIAESADSRGVFRGDLCGDFQKFQVLLERFLEDERSEGKRVMSFVQRRSELMCFFHVPKLSGYKEGGNEEAKGRKGVGAKEVLEVIEKCIQVFYEFVKLDIKRPFWWGTLGTSLFSCPLVEVEDPRDIKLFVTLTNSLQKKEQWLKEIKGKNKKHWLKWKFKPKTMEEFGKQEMMLERLTMIDLKLVSRVLQMPLVSSSHLKWCQHKLDNIHFKDGKISTTFSSFLFPSS